MGEHHARFELELKLLELKLLELKMLRMTKKALFLSWTLLALTACAQTPMALRAETAPIDKGLTSQMLYGFLLGEIASQRGDKRLSAEVYLDLAQRTRDARVAKRAAELASHAQDAGRSMKATRLWLELEPDAERARHALVLVLIKDGQLDGAVQETRHWLTRAGATGAAGVWQFLPGLYARAPKPEAALEALARLAEGYAELAEAPYAVARMAQQINQPERALQAINVALQRRPDWERAALLKAQLLLGVGDQATLDWLAAFLQAQPKANEVRAAYAGALSRVHRLEEAGRLYEDLLQDTPEHAANHFQAGLWALRAGSLELAETRLTRALSLGYPNRGQLHLRLGELAERRRQDDLALQRYLQAAEHEHGSEGLLKAAVVLGRLGRIEEGRRLLASIAPSDEDDRIEILRTEAQMLREGRDAVAALAVLGAALQQYPDHSDLLYDHALVAEGVGQFELAEQGLRRLIALKPRHAHAYNALGYTLADRLNRPLEAIVLLERALELSPGDAFILDSLGWAHFKANHLDEAIRLLREAYAAMRDPEVAGHLGEALWAKGLHAEARVVWQEALKAAPDNALLRNALERR
jgi:tetratricopeptide (TPR) repeat protein